MKKVLLMDFVVDKEKNQIQVKREFAAARALVWDAYTKSDILDQWWAPKPWSARTKSMDFKEGGIWLYAMVSPEGEEHWGKMEYKTINPKDYFQAVDGFCDADGNLNPELPRATWDMNFDDKGEHTLVTNVTTYPDLAQLEQVIQMGIKEGLTMALENLDAVLEGL